MNDRCVCVWMIEKKFSDEPWWWYLVNGMEWNRMEYLFVYFSISC